MSKCRFRRSFIHFNRVLTGILLLTSVLSLSCSDDSTGPTGETTDANSVYTHINCAENGNIAVRIDLPEEPRYDTAAPVVAVASTWFVEKYNKTTTPFHTEYNPVDVGAIAVFNLWPGKTDPATGMSSDGEYDFGGPKSIAALRDMIRFALGLIPDTEGKYLHELLPVSPLYDNVGLFASSHAGVVATNVMAYHGEDLTGLKYFVGRENPTMSEMYALEIGHFDDNHNPVYNPCYDHTGYTMTSLDIEYSGIDWIENAAFPEGRPMFHVDTADDYVLDNKGPHINDKRYFSYALTRALSDYGVFTDSTWPADVAKPSTVEDFWTYRTPIMNFEAIGSKLSGLKVLLPFATWDHVQAAPDKPHIRQAWDGFRKRADLWTRLNCDLCYTQHEIHQSATEAGGFPDNPANQEPDDWFTEAGDWGFAGMLNGQMTARTIPLAGVAEMADRVQADNWDANLDSVLIP
jgi:hypothetical protein